MTISELKVKLPVIGDVSYLPTHDFACAMIAPKALSNSGGETAIRLPSGRRTLANLTVEKRPSSRSKSLN
jgi:hypothetical protein